VLGSTFTLTLHDPAAVLADIVCSAADLWVPQAFDPGVPTVREELWVRPSLDGSLDYTRFHGPRAVTLSLALNPDRLAGSGYGSQSEAVYVLMQWTHPVVRPRIIWTYDSEPARFVDARVAAGSFADQFTDAETYNVVNLGFVVPDGLIHGGAV
jgi:hypothetical protein